jgi:hypothetical protein
MPVITPLDWLMVICLGLSVAATACVLLLLFGGCFIAETIRRLQQDEGGPS